MEQEANKSFAVAIIITFVIAFWIGFFVGWLITGRAVTPASPQSSAQEEESSLPSVFSVPGGENSIEAADQSASNHVRVAAVTLTEEGWIVIHEDRDGAPGNILGAAWLPAGVYQEKDIELLRATETGKRYYAMLHREGKGETELATEHTFDIERDMPLQDARGTVIMASFETISSPR